MAGYELSPESLADLEEIWNFVAADQPAMADILGIPHTWDQTCMIPVAYTTGGDFVPSPRRRVDDEEADGRALYKILADIGSNMRFDGSHVAGTLAMPAAFKVFKKAGSRCVIRQIPSWTVSSSPTTPWRWASGRCPWATPGCTRPSPTTRRSRG